MASSSYCCQTSHVTTATNTRPFKAKTRGAIFFIIDDRKKQIVAAVSKGSHLRESSNIADADDVVKYVCRALVVDITQTRELLKLDFNKCYLAV